MEEQQQAPAPPAPPAPPPAPAASPDANAAGAAPANPPVPINQRRRINRRSINGEVVPERELYKVVFPCRDGRVYTLGLFGSLNDAQRVVDILNMKQAIDAMQPLSTLRMHYTLDRYGVDEETAEEVRLTPIHTVVEDLQYLAVDPRYGRSGAVSSYREAGRWR